MKLNAAEGKKRKDICKYFKYEKLGHICRFCKNEKVTEVSNLKEKSENGELLTSERSQKKEL